MLPDWFSERSVTQINSAPPSRDDSGRLARMIGSTTHEVRSHFNNDHACEAVNAKCMDVIKSRRVCSSPFRFVGVGQTLAPATASVPPPTWSHIGVEPPVVRGVAVRIRVKTEHGTAILDMGAENTVAHLKARIQMFLAAQGASPMHCVLQRGYPPQIMDTTDSTTIAAASLHGDCVTVVRQ